MSIILYRFGVLHLLTHTHTQCHHFKSVRIQGINKRNNSDLNKREENYMQSLEK